MSTDSGPSFARAFGNEHYRGLAFGWMFLALHGAINLFRGSIHLYKSDGGAASIAGIDLSLNGAVILSLFATFGLSQLMMAAIEFAVAFKYRALTPYLLLYHFIHGLGVSVIVYWWRPMPLPDAPGKPGQLVLLVLVAVALWAATRERTVDSEPAVEAARSG